MGESLKVMTYNIQRGLSAVKRRDILAEIVMILELSCADVVCLQEVWQRDGFNEHQLAALCRAGWRHQLWRPIAVFPSGSQGNAVLSRFMVKSWDLVDMSVVGREPRGFLHVEMTSPNGAALELVCAHFGLRARERRVQAEALREFIASRIPCQRPLVLAGDFNDWRGRPGAILPDGDEFKEVIWATTGRFGRTFPSFLPALPLDRIYFRNLSLKTARVVHRLPPVTRMSDHLPVEAVFEV